ncbi:hypothetical protein [Halospeciosus flavus]|uniref:Uncharacterized protein n=1 Tax=Halospeciosus flavus TaxID=3032283 RepID=A0ABD5Z3Y8_9EURY|nr:hypothetical protein [Halospeciosus flavus]
MGDIDIQEVASPTDGELRDVVSTVRGPVVIGPEGTVFAYDDRTDEWEQFRGAGPGADPHELNALAVTDDGRRVWLAGAAGALGHLDLDRYRKTDYTAPMEKTSTWETIAVHGDRGSETVRVANGSGEVLPITLTDDGPEWGEVMEPGHGSTLGELSAGPSGRCVAVDTNSEVYEETADGWEYRGIPNAQVNLNDVLALDDEILVGANDGLVFRYDRDLDNWTPTRIGENAIRAVARRQRDDVVLVASAEGTLFERRPVEGWVRLETDVESDFFAVTDGPEHVAVGEDGVVAVYEPDSDAVADPPDEWVERGAKQSDSVPAERSTDTNDESGDTTTDTTDGEAVEEPVDTSTTYSTSDSTADSASSQSTTTGPESVTEIDGDGSSDT